MLLNHVVLENLQEKVYKTSTNLTWVYNIRTRLFIKAGSIIEQNEKKKNYEVIKGEVVPGENRKVEL